MALVLPFASVQVLNGGLGVAQSGPTNVHVCVGTSSKGPLKQPLQFSRFDDAALTFGCGLMPKAAAYATRASRARYICIRVPAVSEAATVSTITKPTGKTVSVTGTATWGYDVIIVITTGGTIGTSASYKYSLDGGVTYTTPTTLGVATSISLSGTGLTVNLTSGESYSTNDEIRFWTKPASQSIGVQTTTKVGSSTATITASGTPNDEYDVIFEVVKGGTIGTVGIQYRFSLDGGYTYTPATQLGTANSLALLDGTEQSGLTLAFGAGTLDAGDKFTTKTTAPAYQASDVLEALDALHSSAYEWRFIHVVGETNVTKAGSIGGKLNELYGKSVFTYSILSARDHIQGEIDATGQPSVFFHDRLVTDYVNFADDRVAISAGRGRITCPITGRQNRRPASWAVVARLVESEVHVDVGRRLSGALPSDVNLYDTTGRLAEVDSRVRDTLHAARFLTFRTYERNPGVYLTRGNMMSGPDSDYDRIALRAVMDLACEIAHVVAEQQLENHLIANPLTGVQPDAGSVPGQNPVPGALSEADARVLDAEMKTALDLGLVKRGYAVAIGEVRVSRESPFLTTGELEIEVEIVPFGYVDAVKVKIGFQSNKFAA